MEREENGGNGQTWRMPANSIADIWHARYRRFLYAGRGEQKFFWDHFLIELRNQAQLSSQANWICAQAFPCLRDLFATNTLVNVVTLENIGNIGV